MAFKTVADMAAEAVSEEVIAPAGETEVADGTETSTTTTETGTTQATNWLEEFNKTFGTQYKGKEEIDDVFGKAKKVDEYEPKVKEYDSFAKRESDYKKQIEETKRSLNPLSWFSSEDAFRAEQLRKQLPDKNPTLLQEVITKDLGSISDVDILIKKYLLDNPDLPEGDVRLTVYKEYDVDPENPSEVDAVSKTRMRIKANEARKEFSELKASIKTPEILSDEQRAAQVEESRQKKAAEIKPYADKFAHNDTFTAKIGDTEFKFAYPEEFKKTLGDMFTGYFLDGDLDVNEDNLRAIEDMRDGVLLKYNFDSIYKAIEGDVSLRVKDEYDKKLNNEKPINTASGSTETQPGSGMKSFLDRYKKA